MGGDRTGEGSAPPRPRIGVSRCLLGAEVRYDGGHKRDAFVSGALAEYADLVPVCPELEAGFGVPREAMHLSGEPASPRLVTVRTGRDLTEAMRSWTRARTAELGGECLDGFVLKAKSPSCGMERVPVQRGRGVPPRRGRGLFASALVDALPDLPAEEEGRLRDPALRENFVVRVFAYRRFRRVEQDAAARRALVEFHARHKLLLMSRDERALRELDRLVARADADEPRELVAAYRRGFFAGMRRAPTVSGHANTLQHIAAHLRGRADAWDRRELADTIDRFRRGEVSIGAPLALLRHYIAKLDIPDVRDQAYLDPAPAPLLARGR